MRVDENIAKTLEHAVAVVVGESYFVRCNYADETGYAALMVAVGPAFGVGSSKKEEHSALDECSVVISESSAPGHLFKPVSNFAALKLVLQLSTALMIETGHLITMFAENLGECHAHGLYPQSSREFAEKRRQLSPDTEEAFQNFSKAVFAEGALSAKLKQLIAVAVAHTTQCPYVNLAGRQLYRRLASQVSRHRDRSHGERTFHRPCFASPA
jgi:alkylhydroperoxidase/carboxymuconolactone decarboxylase family protein YurZ